LHLHKNQNYTNMEFTNNTQFIDVVERSDLEIHFSKNTEISGIIEENENFGIFKLKMKKMDITKEPTLFLFTMDKTSSMEEYTDTGKTKIDIVIQTMVNILYYLSQQSADVYVRVHGFNQGVDIEIDTVKITKENVAGLVDKIRAVRASGITNIEKALQIANETLHDYSSENTDHQICHIFMTDGYPTVGNDNSGELAEMINENFGNIFVGFGEDHNASLLKSLSEVGTSSYQFVNEMENTSLVYGEMIHSYLYPCVRKATLLVENGLIYNWRTNTWTSRLDEDILVSEIEKIYHIKKDKGASVAIDLHGFVAKNTQELHILNTTEIPHLITMETGDIVENDLTKYMFRHKTQEMLFRSKNLDIDREERRLLKSDLRDFFKKMRDYMRANDLLEDAFMKMLCDDIYVTYSTMDQKQGQMFALARYTSQGRQQTYSATPNRQTSNTTQPDRYKIPLTPIRRNKNTVFRPPILSRSYTQMYNSMCESDEEEKGGDQQDDIVFPDPVTTFDDDMVFRNYAMNMSTVQQCYATPSALNTMTQIQTGNMGSPATPPL
jgi:von Willebrand factor type A domain